MYHPLWLVICCFLSFPRLLTMADTALPGSKDWGRSKWKQARRSRGRGRYTASRGPLEARRQAPALEGNSDGSDDVEEEGQHPAVDEEGRPLPASTGADLAELLEQAQLQYSQAYSRHWGELHTTGTELPASFASINVAKEFELDLEQLASSLAHMPLHLLLGVPEAYVADIPGALAAGTAVQAEGGAQPATQGASQQQQQQYSAARAVAPPTTQAAAPVGPSAPASSEPVSQPPQLPAFMLSRLGGSLQQAPAAAPSPPAQLQPQQVKAPAVVKAAGADEDLTELEELLLTGTATGSKQPPAAVQPTPIRPQLTQQPPLPIWAQPAAGTPGRPLPAAASSSKASPAAADELDELLKPHTSGVTQSLVAQLPKGTQAPANTQDTKRLKEVPHHGSTPAAPHATSLEEWLGL